MHAQTVRQLVLIVLTALLIVLLHYPVLAILVFTIIVIAICSFPDAD
jgi:hypothetical protein